MADENRSCPGRRFRTAQGICTPWKVVVLDVNDDEGSGHVHSFDVGARTVAAEAALQSACGIDGAQTRRARRARPRAAPRDAATVKLGVVSDVHWPRDASKPARWHNSYDFGGLSRRLGAAVGLFDAARVDAALVLGDLSHDGDAESLLAVVTALGAVRSRLWALPGNHDCEERDDQLARVASGRVAFIDRESWMQGGVRLTGLAIVSDSEHGGMRAAGHPDVAQGDLVVLATHFPMISRAGALAERGLAYAGDLLDAPRILAELRGSVAPVVALSGHLHARDSTSEDAINNPIFLIVPIPKIIARHVCPGSLHYSDILNFRGQDGQPAGRQKGGDSTRATRVTPNAQRAFWK